MNTHHPRSARAFTLMEVMLALGIFFMATFAILGVISNGLRNARALQHKPADAGMVASELSSSNAIIEQLESGDFGEMYAGDTWSRDTYEINTNKLFQADMIVRRAGAPPDRVESKMSILLFRPNSPPGSMDGGGPAGGLQR